MRGKRLPLLQPKDAADGAGDEILQADGLQAGGDAGAGGRKRLLFPEAEFSGQNRRVEGAGTVDPQQLCVGEGVVRADPGGPDGGAEPGAGDFCQIHTAGGVLLPGTGFQLPLYGLHHQHRLGQLPGKRGERDFRARNPEISVLRG